MPDDFEWDITEDDEAPQPATPAETSPPVATGPQRRAPSTRLWLALILGVALLALAGVWWSSRDQQQGQLTHTITAMANDEHGPAPLPFGLSEVSSRSLDTITDEGAGRIAARLTFTATLYDGTPLAFTLDRAYVAEGTLLRREQPPADEEAVTLAPATSSARVEFEVLGADREFVQQDIAPYLNDVARRACELWACSPNAFVQVSFTANELAPMNLSSEPTGSMQLAIRDRLRGSAVARLAPPHIAGVPSDAATLDAYRRMLALRILPLLADAVLESTSRPLSAHVNGVVDALVARTAVHLGLEPAAVLDAVPPVDDKGVLNDLSLGQTRMAERTFRRINAILGPTHQEVERLTWRRLGTSAQADALVAFVSALAEQDRDPADALALLFGAAPARQALDLLRRTGWIARAECLDGFHQFEPEGVKSFSWGTSIDRPVFQLYEASDDGLWQPMAVADAPILLDQRTGQLHWLPFADTDNPNGVVLQWLANDELGLASFSDQVRAVRVGLAEASDGEVEYTTTPFGVLQQAFPPDQSDTHLEWTYEPNANDMFARLRLVRQNGTRVVDFGLATEPVFNPDTGEYAVLDLTSDGPMGPEYRVRVFTGPEDTEGRTVWESSNKALVADETPHSGAIAWIPRTHQIALVIQTVESLRDMYVEAGFWLIDPDTAESSRLWWQPVNGIRGQSFALSGDQGYLALSNWDSGSPAVMVQIVSVDTGDTIRTFSLFNGHLSWAPTEPGFMLVDTDSVQLFAAPDQPAAVLRAAGTNCWLAVWGTVPISTATAQQSPDSTVP